MIKMILKAFSNISKLKYDIHIVPVAINHDRIFDSGYLSDEILEGQFNPRQSFLETMTDIWTMRKGSLGKILVKYADPINLKDYVDKFNMTKPPVLNQPFNLSELSMQLTKDLYLIQQQETPINMNAIISSALIFQPKRDSMSIKSVKLSCRNIYDHI